jgi:hypothetical protein
LRFANRIPGDAGGAVPNAALPSGSTDVLRAGGAPVRTRRIAEGNAEDVGVAGRILTEPELCGDERVCLCDETLGDFIETDDVDDAFECVWWWYGMLRMLDTDEEVDLRPRRPPDERRYDDRGVNGAGDAERRRSEPEPWVVVRGREVCVDGGGCV